jgi:hypothetical protein
MNMQHRHWQIVMELERSFGPLNGDREERALGARSRG